MTDELENHQWANLFNEVVRERDEAFVVMYKQQNENELLRQKVAELEGAVRWLENQMFKGDSSG